MSFHRNPEDRRHALVIESTIAFGLLCITAAVWLQLGAQ